MQFSPPLLRRPFCEEAVEFYRPRARAEVTMLMRFKESPDPASVPAGSGGQGDAHELPLGETTVLASDGHCLGRPSFQGFALSLTCQRCQAERIYAALATGARSRCRWPRPSFLPLRHGRDSFGVPWMVYVAP